MLLAASWEIGPLPTESRRLALAIGAQLEELESVWPLVGKKFEITQCGLINRRLEEHRVTQLDKREKAREASLKSWTPDARKRRGRTTSASANGEASAGANAQANASTGHIQTDKHPEPAPYPDPSPELTHKEPRVHNETVEAKRNGIGIRSFGLTHDELGQLKAAYPEGSFNSAQWLLGQRGADYHLDQGHAFEDMLAGTRRYAAQIRAKGHQGTQYVMSPGKFFDRSLPLFNDPFPIPRTKAEVAQEANLDAGREWLNEQESNDAIR